MSYATDAAERRRRPIPLYPHAPKARSEFEFERIASLVVALKGLPVSIGAWCAYHLARRAGSWGDFAGPQSVMTGQYHELARQVDERTAPWYSSSEGRDESRNYLQV